VNIDPTLIIAKSLSQNSAPRSSHQMGAESGKRSASRRHSWRAVSRRRERAPRSEPPDGARVDGRGFGIGSKTDDHFARLEGIGSQVFKRWGALLSGKSV
jgi:hypothetical protein